MWHHRRRSQVLAHRSRRRTHHSCAGHCRASGDGSGSFLSATGRCISAFVTMFTASATVNRKIRGDVILNLAHQFNPHGEGSSGVSYFARLGFAGAARTWNCLVVGSVVFVRRPVVENWPSAVRWNQGDLLLKKWTYDMNPVRPSEVFTFNTSRAGDSQNLQARLSECLFSLTPSLGEEPGSLSLPQWCYRSTPAGGCFVLGRPASTCLVSLCFLIEPPRKFAKSSSMTLTTG